MPRRSEGFFHENRSCHKRTVPFYWHMYGVVNGLVEEAIVLTKFIWKEMQAFVQNYG